MFEIMDTQTQDAVIKVIGVGGCGGNAVDHMIDQGVQGVEFIVINTDAQALKRSKAQIQLQIGVNITKGLGAGAKPSVGQAAAEEDRERIKEMLSGAHMIFITAGMGGGTGTGAAPVAAEIARELGAVVVSVVTLPFTFEMTRRAQNALHGVRALQPHSHTLITVPNDRLIQVAPRDISLEIAFRLADDILRQGVQGIAELVTQAGLINVDFAHVRNLMLRGGGALMAIGIGEGHNMARAAIRQALHHPLMAIDSLEGANGVLVHFTGGDDLTLHEVGAAVDDLRSNLSPEIELILGATTDPAMTGRAQAILVVTGVGGQPAPTQAAVPVAQHVTETVTIQTGPPIAQDDLDLPTFLRRRVAV